MKREFRVKFLEEAFQTGSTSVVGEKSTAPIRKKTKLSNIEDSNYYVGAYYTPSDRISSLSYEDIEQIRYNNKIKIEGSRIPPPILDFTDISNIPRNVLEILLLNKIVIPTPIQMQGIPSILSGRDVILLAQTGTGKTITYLLPVVMRLMNDLPNYTLKQYSSPKILIIVPTRELVEQLLLTFNHFFVAVAHIEPDLHINTESSLCNKYNHTVFGVCGGIPCSYQINILQMGIDILIGTPGRIVDLLSQQQLNLQQVLYCVLDEFDRIISEGMESQIRSILGMIPSNGVQFIMCSATFPTSLTNLANSIVHKPINIRVGIDGQVSSNIPLPIEHSIVYVDSKDKKYKLLSVIRSIKRPPVLIFCNSINCVEDIVKFLRLNQFHVAPLHSKLTQQIRFIIINAFREEGLDILVSTDLASRGLDIDNINTVIIYELPLSIEDFIHRSGRTGRAGNHGKVISFVTPDPNVPEGLRTLLREISKKK